MSDRRKKNSDVSLFNKIAKIKKKHEECFKPSHVMWVETTLGNYARKTVKFLFTRQHWVQLRQQPFANQQPTSEDLP
jgi:hypothetical protein